MKAFTLFILLATVLNINGQGFIGTPPDCVTNPPDFGKLTYDEANAAVKSQENLILGRKAIKICPEYITNLLFQLRHEQLTSNNKTIAIYFLGSLRSEDTDSIEFLIENIDFKATKMDSNLSPVRWGQYPAEQALIKIGQPTVIPLLNHIANETVELRRHLMCEVLQKVIGVEDARNRIKHSRDAESDAQKIANFESALDELKKL